MMLVVGGLPSGASAGWPFDGCKKKEKKTVQPVAHTPCAEKSPCPESELSALPPSAAPGECYAKVYIPATFKTVTERVLVQEASEELEVIPAEFKWVEEQICVKQASTQLEVVPAEYKWAEKTIQTAAAYTGWVIQKAADCVTPDKKDITGEVFCLRTTPPEHKTIRIKCLAKPPTCREVNIPAEYQTIRRQVVAKPASTRRIPIPAEYEDITKTVMVCPERVKWEHIVCKEKLTTATIDQIKLALTTAGYEPGPVNGELGTADWAALAAFQQKNGLGVGQLSYETLKKLKVSVE
jgi:hypothetical protein